MHCCAYPRRTMYLHQFDYLDKDIVNLFRAFEYLCLSEQNKIILKLKIKHLKFFAPSAKADGKDNYKSV